MRPHPLMFDDEASPPALSPFEGADGLVSDANPSLLGLPAGESMLTARAVRPSAKAGPAVAQTLAAILEALRTAAKNGRAWRKRLDGLSAADQALVLDALGQGEVSVVLSGAPGEGDAQIHETVLPGVWIGQAQGAQGERVVWVEVGSAPRALYEAAETRPRDTIAIEALSAPRGAMNVMSVLSEVSERADAWTPKTPNHVINFTLFPMTEADQAFLAKVLGEVGVRVASGGYGAARVIMTALKRVWAVQYLNAMGTVILDTIEVGDIPSAALASREDFEDSAERLAEIAEAYAL